MGMYRKEWGCCGSITETDAWEPEDCPFCKPLAHQAEPVEPVATLTAQRDALLEALKYHQEQTRPIQRTLDVIKAVEEWK